MNFIEYGKNVFQRYQYSDLYNNYYLKPAFAMQIESAVRWHLLSILHFIMNYVRGKEVSIYFHWKSFSLVSLV